MRASHVILKGAAGFLVGLALWLGLRSPYNELMAGMAGPVIRRIEPNVTWVRPLGDRIAIDRTDLPSHKVEVEARLFTFNVIILFALFATNRAPLTKANLVRLALSWVILALTQALAIVAAAESLFSRGYGAWSDLHYSALATDASLIIAQGYMLVGGYAIVFALWWATMKNEK